ncbi:MAG TPA: hypothetical protein VHT52_04115, partial [Stellaceae bacterium]|nr:hypothetical protein [Stellaceae bacterium]
QAQSQLMIKQWKRAYAEIMDNDGRGVDITGTFTTQDGGVPAGVEDVAFQVTRGAKHQLVPFPLHGAGIAGCFDIQSTSPDFTIQRLHVTYEERTLFGA